MTAPDLPAPRESFRPDHLARWPMGGERVELDDGELVWAGDFDERDAVVGRRAFPGHRVRIEPGVGLIVGPAPADRNHEHRQWADEDGTEWDTVGGAVLRRGPGGQDWLLQPWTAEQRRRNREQVAANRAEGWAAVVAQYAAHPGDMEAAWEYLQAHPIFWSWVLPQDLADVDPATVDEAGWARIEAESWLNHNEGMYHVIIDASRSREPDAGSPASRDTAVRLEHGPVLWPLDVPAGHRAGFRPGGTPLHDPGLDVVEPTWEAAILALAAKVRARYGDDRAGVADPPPGAKRE